MKDTSPYRTCPTCSNTHSYRMQVNDRHLRGVKRSAKADGGTNVPVPNFVALNRKLHGPKGCGLRSADPVDYSILAMLTATAARAGFIAQLINKFTLHLDDNVSVLLRKSAT